MNITSILRQKRNFPQKKINKQSIVQSRDNSDVLFPSHNKTFWQKLKSALFPHLRNSKHIAEILVEARVEKERSEARKISEQANEIAARKDLIKQNETKAFNSIVNDIFADDGLPPVGKVLKLAKLIENNPGIEARLEEANKISQKSCLGKCTDEFEYVETKRTDNLIP